MLEEENRFFLSHRRMEVITGIHLHCKNENNLHNRTRNFRTEILIGLNEIRGCAPKY